MSRNYLFPADFVKFGSISPNVIFLTFIHIFLTIFISLIVDIFLFIRHYLHIFNFRTEFCPGYSSVSENKDVEVLQRDKDHQRKQDKHTEKMNLRLCFVADRLSGHRADHYKKQPAARSRPLIPRCKPAVSDMTGKMPPAAKDRGHFIVACIHLRLIPPGPFSPVRAAAYGTGPTAAASERAGR